MIAVLRLRIVAAAQFLAVVAAAVVVTQTNLLSLTKYQEYVGLHLPAVDKVA